MMIIDPSRFGGSAPADIQYLASYTTPSFAGNVNTFSGVGFGALGQRRMIVIAVHWVSASSGASLSSATIGGVTAQIFQGSVIGPDSGSIYYRAALIWALVPTGTSGNVVLTYGASTGANHIFVYRAENVASDTPYDTATATATNSPVTVNIDEQAQGIVIAAGTTWPLISGRTWSGVTEAYDDGSIFSGGCANTLTAASNVAISQSDTAGPNGSPNRVVVAASFR